MMAKIDLSSSLGLTYENKVILGEWHQDEYVQSHRRYTQRETCTVSELWAAIEALERCSYDEGYDEGAGDPSATGATRAAKDRVRALLGLEPEG